MSSETYDSSNIGTKSEDNIQDEYKEGDTLPKLEIKEPPGFLRFLPPIIKQMAELGADFKMTQDGMLFLEGFYKNGPMKLDFKPDGSLVAIDKRHRETLINSFEDLVVLNYKWWKTSNTSRTYVVPERPWLDQFMKNKWVKRKVIWEPVEEDDNKEDK